MKHETNQMRKKAYWASHAGQTGRRPARPAAEPHPARVLREDQCPLYRKCGGCQMQNLPYDDQLRWKQAQEVRLLGKFGRVASIMPMARPLHYRNKVQAAFGTARNGRIISGVYQSGTHRIVPVDHCLIEDEQADRIIVTIRQLLRSFRIAPYDEDAETGLLRHVLVRRAFRTGEIMVVLVTARPAFPSRANFVETLVQRHPEITTVVQNINPGHTSMVLGEREEVLYGPGRIEDELCGCRFRISSRSFYQVNPVQTEVLYQKAMEFAALTGSETVIDAYCGTGTIALIAARQAKQVIGVELNGDAVRDAIANAKLNGQTHARFYTGDAGEFMQRMAAAGEHADVVFMDPPRAGSDRRFLSSLLTLAPDRVVYISCNPETLARDLWFLTQHGYRVRRIQPVDMFPHTHHIETVCFLSKLQSKEHIEIEAKTDKLDLTLAERKTGRPAHG